MSRIDESLTFHRDIAPIPESTVFENDEVVDVEKRHATEKQHRRA